MRSVTIGEVLAEASRKCRTCLGRGYFESWKFIDEDTKKRTPEVCGCAKRRFDAKHGDDKVLRRDDGSMYWREDGLVLLP